MAIMAAGAAVRAPELTLDERAELGTLVIDQSTHDRQVGHDSSHRPRPGNRTVRSGADLIFEPFYRGSGAGTTNGQPGSGLGLAIAKGTPLVTKP